MEEEPDILDPAPSSFTNLDQRGLSSQYADTSCDLLSAGAVSHGC